MSSGGSKQSTIGYWYHMDLVFGLCDGIDAFLEFRGGDRTAWSGALTQSGTIGIDQSDLWGGAKSEGGISGDVDVMFGDADQAKNAYLISRFGADQGAYRGRAVVVFKGGRYGAMNPYPKAASFKVRRIKSGWLNDTCWYPDRAEIYTGDYAFVNAFSVSWNMVATAPDGGTNGYYTNGVAGKVSTFTPGDGQRHTVTLRVVATVELRSYPGGTTVSTHVTRGGTPGDNGSYNVYSVRISSPAAVYYLNAGSSVPQLTSFDEQFTVEIDDGATVTLTADSVDGHMIGQSQTLRIDVPTLSSGGIFMNPAHVLYDSVSSASMMGEPVGLISDESFKAAADKLYSEAFGICTTYDSTSESIEDFQQRICDVIGGSLTRDRRTGLWHLDLARGDYVLADLPILTDDDILDYAEDPSTLDDAVNSLMVEWFDPFQKETRTTVPVQSLGLIQSYGGVISDTLSRPEIPDEALALRVAARDLRAKATPLRRFDLKTNRVPYAWRPGTYFRLQSPKRGIVDMVCMVGEIDVGTLQDGAISLTAIQDVFGMPATTYISGQTAPSSGSVAPTASPYQRLIEVPYIELVQTLSAADLAYLATDVGYIAAMGSAPSVGLNYSLVTAAEGETLTDRGTGDWTPVVVTSVAYGYLDSVISIGKQSGISSVATPCAAIWDDEIIRVDSIDTTAATVTIARGCADTVPQKHAAESVIFFYDTESRSDSREYTDGEVVSAKLLTRAGGTRLAASAAVALSCTMQGRWARPYPPANMLINGTSYPQSISGELNLSWTTRNRLTQGDTLLETTATSVGVEDGQTTTAGALLREWADLTGTGLTYSLDQEITDGGGTATEDPLWSSVALCLTFDGAEGATTLADLSPTPKTVTANGNAHITAARYQYNKSSLALDGNGDYLSIPASSAWNFGTGDFCLEAGVYLAESSIPDGNGYRGVGLIFVDAGSGSSKMEWVVMGSTSASGIGLQLGLDPGTGFVYIQGRATIPIGEFVRLKCSRTSGVVSFYVNDGHIGGGSFAYAIGNSTYPLKIGGRPWDSNFKFWLNGNISYVRITGAARETADLPSYQPPGRYVFSNGVSSALRIELESKRDGVTSMQKHDFTIKRDS